MLKICHYQGFSHTLNRLASTCKSIKLKWSKAHYSRTDRDERNKKRKAATVEKNEVHWLKRWHVTQLERKTGGREWDGGRKRNRRVFLSRLCGMTSFMHSSCVCQSRPGGVCWIVSQGGMREGEEGEEVGGVKRGMRAETLSCNSGKWADPDRGRLCPLCGLNKSTVFRT